MTVILLGPQRFRSTVRKTVRSLEVDGPIATVTAGWQEREPDDAELDGLLDGRSLNLGLYYRLLDIEQRDPELAAAERKRLAVVDELRSVYDLRLGHATAAVYELVVRDISARIAEAAVDDAIAALHELDRRHLDHVAEISAEFYETWRLHERPAVAEHREAVAAIVRRAGAVAIAGGHVGALLSCLHLLNVAPTLAGKPVVAWSAGAMTVTDRVVLFNDRSPDGRSYAEVHDAGLGLCHGVVALPHARRRLRLDDPVRVAVFARRFSPDRCVVLDDGARVDCGDGQGCPSGTTILTEDGRLDVLAEAVA